MMRMVMMMIMMMVVVVVMVIGVSDAGFGIDATNGSTPQIQPFDLRGRYNPV
jgi:hypothetical protein